MDHLELDDADTAAPIAGKRDGRTQTSKANGAKGGAPLGKGQADKLTYDPDKLASNLADRILSGKGLPMNPFARATQPTEEDNRHVARITGMPVEQFQTMISAKLQVIAEKTTDRILEKLEDGSNQRLSDLNMTMAISIDKLAAISGRTAQAGNVSVTVNNYGTMSRAEMLATVAAEAKHAPIEV